MSETLKAQKEQLAQMALDDPKLLEELISRLDAPSRRVRQNAASVLSVASHKNAEVFLPYVDSFLNALERPEAQTKWESVEVLGRLLPFGLTVTEDLLGLIEDALFDEESGSLRLSAMRFVCVYGSLNPLNSDRVWPLIDEAIQCYHGDPEFQEMLSAVLVLSESELSESVSSSLCQRMSFDAQHARGALKKKAQHILDNLS